MCLSFYGLLVQAHTQHPDAILYTSYNIPTNVQTGISIAYSGHISKLQDPTYIQDIHALLISKSLKLQRPDNAHFFNSLIC